MPLYESTFILRQDMSRQDVARVIDGYIGIIEQGGGKIVKNEYWGLKTLAYRVKKSRKAHYNMLGIDAPYDPIKEVERQSLLSEEVLRQVTIRVDELTEEPSVMMRGSRDDAPASNEEAA